MRLLHELRVIVNRAIGRGILKERAENRLIEFEARVIVGLNFDSERLRPRPDNFDRLWMAIISDKKSFSIRNGGVTKCHCFGGGGRLIEHGRVGNVEFGKIDNHRLKIQQRFEPALRELGLVRCVSGVPARVFEDVPLNYRRGDGVRITSPDERFRDFVFLRDCAQFGECFAFRFRFRQI